MTVQNDDPMSNWILLPKNEDVGKSQKRFEGMIKRVFCRPFIFWNRLNRPFLNIKGSSINDVTQFWPSLPNWSNEKYLHYYLNPVPSTAVTSCRDDPFKQTNEIYSEYFVKLARSHFLDCLSYWPAPRSYKINCCLQIRIISLKFQANTSN